MQTFDTYEYIQELQKADVPLKQAEAHSNALKRLFDLDELATKRDLNDLKTELNAKIDSEISDLKTELNTKIDQAIISLIKWLVPMLLGQAALIIALLKYFGFSPAGG